jgi:hypothetical protein
LLAFQPLPDYDAENDTEYQFTAAAQKDFIISVLLSKRTRSIDLSCWYQQGVGHNARRSTDWLWKSPINLAVKRFLEPIEAILKKIHELMVKLSTSSQIATCHTTAAG